MIRNLLLVAKREYIATVRSKAFIIGLIVAPLFMGGSIIAMGLLHDKVDTTDREVRVVDYTNQIGDSLIATAQERNQNDVFDRNDKKIRPAYLLSLVEPGLTAPDELRLQLSDAVRAGEIYGFLEIGPEILDTEPAAESTDDLRAGAAFYSKNPALDDMRSWLRGALNERIRHLHLTRLGIDPALAESLFKWHAVQGMELVQADESGAIQDARKANELATFATPAAMMIFLFMLIMMGSMPLLNSVMEEKNQHIAETLLSSITPFEFMFGKVLGGVGISFTASAFYISGALIMLANMGLMGFVPLHLLLWFLIYLVLAILMMGSIMAAIGSACTDMKESQNLTLPAMLPIMVPMFVMMPVIKEPLSTFATTLSLIPPFTPLVMMLRQAVPGGVPFWQPLVGLAGLFLFTILCIWVGSRIFRIAILLKGKTPSFATLIRWSIRG